MVSAQRKARRDRQRAHIPAEYISYIDQDGYLKIKRNEVIEPQQDGDVINEP